MFTHLALVLAAGIYSYRQPLVALSFNLVRGVAALNERR
jgi:uncharacterized membrane protein affecting hemolysin expression